uniref:Uncharacterized protein AlNc14C10G1260 n=1 Tax=Albugo laibachii Nc14 TaxID=890382 RepID=F0W2L3_9STRA|nr:conserved hypothetical protein [Albugo laibachii Nc14]|eukprot:CCA15299.1 conserved hypothetical protein [Albugo laibachii Nc14]
MRTHPHLAGPSSAMAAPILHDTDQLAELLDNQTELSASSLLDRLRQNTTEKNERMATVIGRRAELNELTVIKSRWAYYRTLCQFRFGYLTFIVTLIILIFSVTLLMEIFFAIFLPSAQEDPHYMLRSTCLLASLPFFLIVLSYIFEETLRLFRDAIDKTEGSLRNFRLALAVVIHFFRHRKEMPEDRMDFVSESHQTRSSSDTPSNYVNVYRCCSWILRLGAHLSSLFVVSDPFDDKNKEYEDEVRLHLQAAFNEQRRNGSKIELKVLSQAPSSRWKRAVSAATTTQMFNRTMTFDGPPLDFTTLVIVDLICPVFFEITTGLHFVLAFFKTFSIVHAFLHYIQTGVFVLLFYLLLWSLCHCWSSRNRKMREFVSNYRRCRRAMKRVLEKIEMEKRSEKLLLVVVGFRAWEFIATVFYSMVESAFCCLRRCKNRIRRCLPFQFRHAGGNTVSEQRPLWAESSQLPIVNANHTSTELGGKKHMKRICRHINRWNIWRQLSFQERLLILVPITILSAVISCLSFFIGWGLMGLCLIMLSSIIQSHFPQIFGATFRAFIVCFVTISFIFFSSTFIIGTFVGEGSFTVYPPKQKSDKLLLTTKAYTHPPVLESLSLRSQVAKYPVCCLNFSSLDVIDFALMADGAYASNKISQHRTFSNRFNGTDLGDWEIIAQNSEKAGHQVWVELYFHRINMTVIVVRGTASAVDALEDLHFWFGVCVMQAVNLFLPLLRQLPDQLVVSMLSMSVFKMFMPPPMYKNFIQHIQNVRARVGDRLVLTGHSLGGAMAAMAGAKVKVPVISFSGPGLLYSRGRFGIKEQDIRDHVVTIKPQNDIVPQIDELIGMVQEIDCRQDSVFACHSTYTHLCELYFSCGDHRHRDWSHAVECQQYMAG